MAELIVRNEKGQFTKGSTYSHWSGKSFSDEHKQKISSAGKGKVISAEQRIKLSTSHKGKHTSPKTEFKKGHPTYLLTHTEETREKIRISKLGKHFPNAQGENHYNWNNGSSLLPYGKEFTKRLREEVRDLDEHRCQICLTRDSSLGKKLDVHHIDYSKTNNNVENLISLCKSCHMKTGKDRIYWEQELSLNIGGLNG